MGRLSEFFGRLAGNQSHGRLSHLNGRVSAGGSRPKTRPGPLEATYDARAVPERLAAGGFTYSASLPRRMIIAGELTRLLVRMRSCYDTGDRQGFDALVGWHDALFARLDDRPDDFTMMGQVNREICFPAWTHAET